ncbi:DUF302 domain-containing protein [Thiothrix lacustris]|jgi:hypothetical protein|uniref:DUF302 domain-containing protein n=1 Tax=Thiothrix lacustris TaxID=525917 RepID=A0ABY9MMF2_9GAMM|nr:DUF302 domain-containing protein [Thiothrix lacustris]WML89728.1 DUF302 domain-containing protein [Thiothrix lacustris]
MLVKIFSICVMALTVLAMPVSSMADNDMIIIRQIEKTPEVFAKEVEDYAKKREWNFLGSHKVKKGEITLIKFCVAEVGKQLWKQGLQMSALAPCGNIGVYQKDGKTEISVLNPRYMNILAPSAEMEKLSAAAEKDVMEMLDVLAK